MRIDIISAVPKLLESPFNDSILKRAQERKLVEIKIHNLRDYSTNKQKSIDDYAFGGGAGMVLSIEPVFNCIQKLQKKTKYDEIIFMTPDGEQLNQSYTNQLSLKKNFDKSFSKTPTSSPIPRYSFLRTFVTALISSLPIFDFDNLIIVAMDIYQILYKVFQEDP